MCGMFMGEINIWRGGLSKVDCPSQCGWAASNLWGTWREWKTGKGGFTLSVFKLGHWPLLHLDWNLHNQLTWFSGLQTHIGTIRLLCWVSGRSWIFWVSRLYESIPYNKYNNIYPVSSVSLENPDSKIANLYWLLHRKHELLCSKHWTLITFFKLSHLHHTKTLWGRYY